MSQIRINRKIILIITIAILCCTNVIAQNDQKTDRLNTYKTEYAVPVNGNQKVRFVSAKNGLFLRKDPDQKAEKLRLLPYDALILVKEILKKDTIDGIESKWIKTEISSVVGYVFGGYTIEKRKNKDEVLVEIEKQMKLDYPNGFANKREEFLYTGFGNYFNGLSINAVICLFGNPESYSIETGKQTNGVNFIRENLIYKNFEMISSNHCLASIIVKNRFEFTQNIRSGTTLLEIISIFDLKNEIQKNPNMYNKEKKELWLFLDGPNVYFYFDDNERLKSIVWVPTVGV